MKSISEKAEEYARMKHTDKSLIDIVSWDFEAGANYVLDIIEQCLTPQKCFTEHGIDVCAEALVITALQAIKQLKK